MATPCKARLAGLLSSASRPSSKQRVVAHRHNLIGQLLRKPNIVRTAEGDEFSRFAATSIIDLSRREMI